MLKIICKYLHLFIYFLFVYSVASMVSHWPSAILIASAVFIQTLHLPTATANNNNYINDNNRNSNTNSNGNKTDTPQALQQQQHPKSGQTMWPITNCAMSEFTCTNGKCIQLNKFCDKVNDCGDSSDEPRFCTRKCQHFFFFLIIFWDHFTMFLIPCCHNN